MSTKGKARGRKATEQENVVDSTTDTVNGNGDRSEAAAVAGKKSAPTKRKLVKTAAEDVAPAKRSGRTKAIEPPPPAEPVKSKRGAEAKKVVDETTVGEPKRGRGRTKAAALKEESEPKATKRGAAAAGNKKAKAAAADSNGTDKPEAEIQAAGSSSSVARKGRGGVKSSGKLKESVEEVQAEPEPEKPKRGGRASKTPFEEENGTKTDKKPIKTAGAKKMVSGGGSAARGRKRPAVEPIDTIVEEIENGNDEDDNDDVEEKEEIITAGKKTKRTTKQKATKVATTAGIENKVNETETNYAQVDFNIDKEFNLKISSWNVAGLRAWIKKGGVDYVNYEKPDILCLQEIKCVPELIPDEARLSGYHPYWLCKPGGHGGVAIYSKIMPINVEYGLNDTEQDEDGRILTAEYEKFFLICVYVPNAGRKLVSLAKRLRWNKLFAEFVEKLNAIKPVVICGDMNVAHNEIDLTNPKTNKKNAGFTQEERDGMTEFLSLGYVDTFRSFYPDQKKAYTFWSYFMNSRKKNVGWRLDYFIVSQRFLNKCVNNVIRSEILGSDHCPIVLFLNA